ncbi:MAG: hypothetical protein NT002_00300 [candidate division Zixibacteria bacterium]|nr:hypothetical protein [candidate division Zixibacteria bacterium]
MKAAARILGALFLILMISFFLTPVPEILARDKTAETFVDYDGDGFDDNAPGGDGIPTSMENPSNAESATEAVPDDSPSAGMFDLSGGNAAAIDIEMSNSSAFGSRQFVARSLTQNRCSLDSDIGFGSSAGIGIGVMSGGMVCSGGVCHPR